MHARRAPNGVGRQRRMTMAVGGRAPRVDERTSDRRSGGHLRVAMAARRASAMPAIMLSRIRLRRPLAPRSAARRAAASALDVSNVEIRPASAASKSLFVRAARARRRCASGIRAIPKRTSNTVILVVQMSDGACWFNQSFSTGSGTFRVSSDMTFVSSRITGRIRRVWPAGREAREIRYPTRGRRRVR